MKQEKLLGNIGINSDDDPRYFGEDDTTVIMNMLPGTSGRDQGLVKTLAGNYYHETGIDWIRTASHKVIGTCKRVSDDTIYYFVKCRTVHANIRYGYLYNYYAASDPRNIAASGWHVPTLAEITALRTHLGTNAGGKLKETGTLYWNTPNTDATNEVGFNGRGAGYRDADGLLGGLKTDLYLWAIHDTPGSYARISYDNNTINIGGGSRTPGYSIRLCRATTTDEQSLADGTPCDSYVGNDKKIYRTVKIGAMVWLADNLGETMFRDGTAIAEVNEVSEWAALEDSALCFHNNIYNVFLPEGSSGYIEGDDYNSIIELNPLDNTFRVIVFEEQYLYMGDWVVGAMVFGDYIIYNSGDHGMRKVHIEYAYRYYNSMAGATYPTVTSTTFALRNMPPTGKPTCTYSTNGLLQNNVINKTFQFAYRYKYVDGGFSVYSEYSDVCLPPNVETFNGGYEFELYDYNTIEVEFDRGSADIIEYVEVVVREGNKGSWRLLDVVYDNISTVAFTNSENYESVEQDEVAKPEDAIPLRVADATLINENRLVLARCTEGFDNITPDVSLIPITEAITIETPAEAAKATRYLNDQSEDERYYSINTSDLATPADYAVGNILRISLRMIGETRSVDHVLTAPEVVDLEHLVWTIVGEIGALLGDDGTVGWVDPPGSAAAWNSIDTDQFDIEIELTPGVHNAIYDGSIMFLDASVVNQSNKWNTYKSDATHPHAIQYWDEEFRRSTIMRSPSCDVYVGSRGGLGSSLYYRVKLDWTISHMAPSWAKYWSWAYAGNKTQSWFVQYIIAGVNGSIAAPNDSYLGIDISPLQLLKTDNASIDLSLPSSVIDAYEYAPGDRVRFIAAENVAGTDFGIPFSGNAYYDLPIMGFEDNLLLVPLPDAGGSYGLAANSLIEIYSPRTFDETYEPYCPVGPINDVVDGYHMNPDGVSQAAGVAAEGTLESGDAYVIARAFSVQLTNSASTADMYAVESMHWSDFYQSDAYDGGKPNVYSSLGEVTHNSLRWGWKHFTGSSVDNLFTFDPSDSKPTTEIYGGIVRIGEMGDVLKVIFERKVASMYIGKREVYDASGSVFTVQDSVLSNPNYSIEDYGTTDQRAVLFVRGYCYFVDFNAGAIIRNTNNGSYPISGKADAGGEGADYKMHSYFRDVCANALRFNYLSPYSTILGWDDGRKVLYVSILQPGFSEYTVAFRESRGRWVSFLEFRSDPDAAEVFYPTCYQWAGNKFYSWLDGNDGVWEHDSTMGEPLTIYGHKKTAFIDIWCNAYPNQVKVFNSIAIHSDVRGWRGEVMRQVGPSYPYNDGIISVLPAHEFELREGVQYASYLGNMESSGVISAPDLYNGEPLRGYTLGNRLYIDVEASLFKVDINYQISEV